MTEVEKLFRTEGKWVLPTSGTLGRKAENLLANTPIIEAQGFRIGDPSLVVPFEYVAEHSPDVVLGWIKHFFRDVPGIEDRKKLNHL